MARHVPKGLSIVLFLSKRNKVKMMVSLSMLSNYGDSTNCWVECLNGFCFQAQSRFDRVFACHIEIEVFVLCCHSLLRGTNLFGAFPTLFSASVRIHWIRNLNWQNFFRGYGKQIRVLCVATRPWSSFANDFFKTGFIFLYLLYVIDQNVYKSDSLSRTLRNYFANRSRVEFWATLS